MISRPILLGVLLGVVVVVVAGGIYMNTFSITGPRTVSVKDLAASPAQFNQSNVKVRGILRVIYSSDSSAQFFLDDNGASVRVEFPASIWGSPPMVGLYIGKQVEVVGNVRTIAVGEQTKAVLEVQTITLLSSS